MPLRTPFCRALAILAALTGAGAGAAADQARPMAPAGIVLAQAQLDASRQLAGMVARLAQLEEELRRLRGRVEELEFRQRQLDQGGTPATATAVPPRGATPSPGASPPLDLSGPGLSPAQPPPTAPPAQVARLDPNAPPREQYEAGLQLLQRGDWSAAEGAFSGFVERFPDDALAANAAYWLGETFYIRRDYTNAAAVFARNYRNYGPDAQKAPDNLLKLGMSLAALGDRDRACQTFAELARRHDDAAAPIKQTLLREQAAAGCA